jgi:hypothetical protein
MPCCSTMEERAKALANILGSCITSAVNSAAQDSAVIDRSKRSHEYSCHDLEAHAHPAALIQITSAGPARVINPVAPQPAAIVPRQQQIRQVYNLPQSRQLQIELIRKPKLCFCSSNSPLQVPTIHCRKRLTLQLQFELVKKQHL